jgi:hypothetical protein
MSWEGTGGWMQKGGTVEGMGTKGMGRYAIGAAPQGMSLIGVRTPIRLLG